VTIRIVNEARTGDPVVAAAAQVVQVEAGCAGGTWIGIVVVVAVAVWVISVVVVEAVAVTTTWVAGEEVVPTTGMDIMVAAEVSAEGEATGMTMGPEEIEMTSGVAPLITTTTTRQVPSVVVSLKSGIGTHTRSRSIILTCWGVVVEGVAVEGELTREGIFQMTPPTSLVLSAGVARATAIEPVPSPTPIIIGNHNHRLAVITIIKKVTTKLLQIQLNIKNYQVKKRICIQTLFM
jgi:hypothetical protein